MIIISRNKKWRDLTTTEKASLVLRGIVQFELLAMALVDIHRRSAEEINGSKWVWSAVALVNFMGIAPLVYFNTANYFAQTEFSEVHFLHRTWLAPNNHPRLATSAADDPLHNRRPQ